MANRPIYVWRTLVDQKKQEKQTAEIVKIKGGVRCQPRKDQPIA